MRANPYFLAFFRTDPFSEIGIHALLVAAIAGRELEQPRLAPCGRLGACPIGRSGRIASLRAVADANPDTHPNAYADPEPKSEPKSEPDADQFRYFGRLDGA